MQGYRPWRVGSASGLHEAWSTCLGCCGHARLNAEGARHATTRTESDAYTIMSGHMSVHAQRPTHCQQRCGNPCKCTCIRAHATLGSSDQAGHGMSSTNPVESLAQELKSVSFIWSASSLVVTFPLFTAAAVKAMMWALPMC